MNLAGEQANKEDDMKKYFGVAAAIAIFIASVAGAYAATGTSTVGATATITNICVVSGGSIAFGSLDPTTAGPYLGGVTNPSLWCTTSDGILGTDNGGENGTTGGTPVTGATWRLKSGSNYIPYTLTYTSALTGAGKSSDIGGQGGGKLSIAASIAAGAIDNVPAGAYSDSVILTFTY